MFVETKATVFGGQKALLARCAELDRRGLTYRIIHPFSGSIFLEQYRGLALRGALVTPQKPLGKAGQALFILRHLRRLAAVGLARTVHCDAFDSAYLAAMLRKVGGLCRSELIFTVRSERYLRFNALDRFLIGAFDRLATNSAYSRDRICAVTDLSPDSIFVTYSPIVFTGLPVRAACDLRSADTEVRVGYVGSFDRRKRLDRFVTFGLALMQAWPERRFLFRIYGVAKTEEQIGLEMKIRARIAAAGAEERFDFCGYVPTAEIAQQIDMLVCPFDNEPLGRVVPEFLYMGLPVIAHDDGGLREAGAGAARMVSGEDEQALEQAFLRETEALLSEPPRSDAEAEALRDRLVERFGRAAVVDKELEMYALPDALHGGLPQQGPRT